MSKQSPHAFRSARVPASRQRGVVLLFALIAVVIMLIAAVALIRSYNASLFMAGNIGFKRDLQNESERAVAAALSAFRTGGALSTRSSRSASQPTANYSATALTAVNNQGVPTVLQSAATMSNAGYNLDTMDPSLQSASNPGIPDSSLAGTGISYRYVIDRLCNATGDEGTLGSSNCIVSTAPAPTGGSETNLMSATQRALCATCVSAQPQSVVYRVSVRIQGPRNTVSFFQSTLTVPSS